MALARCASDPQGVSPLGRAPLLALASSRPRAPYRVLFAAGDSATESAVSEGTVQVEGQKFLRELTSVESGWKIRTTSGPVESQPSRTLPGPVPEGFPGSGGGPVKPADGEDE